MHGIYVKSFKLGLSLFFYFQQMSFFYLRRRKVCQNEKVKWLNAHLRIHRNSLSNKLFTKKLQQKVFIVSDTIFTKKKIAEWNRHFSHRLRFFIAISQYNGSIEKQIFTLHLFLFSRKPDPDPVPTDPGKSVPFGFRLSLLDFIDDEDNIENKKVVYKDINAASQ